MSATSTTLDSMVSKDQESLDERRREILRELLGSVYEKREHSR